MIDPNWRPLHSLPSLQEVLRHDQPYTLPSIVEHLLTIGRVCLDDHGYDRHGHECVSHAANLAEEWLNWMQERGLYERPAPEAPARRWCPESCTGCRRYKHCCTCSKCRVCHESAVDCLCRTAGRAPVV